MGAFFMCDTKRVDGTTDYEPPVVRYSVKDGLILLVRDGLIANLAGQLLVARFCLEKRLGLSRRRTGGEIPLLRHLLS